MADKPKDHTKTIDTIKKTVGELKKNMNKVTKGHEKMATRKDDVPSQEDHKAALAHFASQYKIAMMNKEEDKAKEYAKSYHEYAAKLDKHYHSKLKESVDICPECMEEPCACGGNHLGEEMNPYQDDEQIDEGTSAAVRMQRALNKVQDARKRQERLAAPYVKSVMGKKEEKKKEVSEASYNVRKDPIYQKYDPQTHTMMFKDGKHKVVKHDQVAKHKAQGYKVRSSVKAFIKGQAMSEAKADPTSSWVVHDGDKVKRFKTHEGAKAHAQKHGGKVASSAHYADKIQGKQNVAEGDDRGDYYSTARAANQASRTAKSKQDHAKAADLHSRAATYGLSAGQDQSVIRDHQMAAWEHNRASKGLKKQGVAEAAGTKPGWMLKQDPALAKKIADAKKLAKARKASYGDPSKGVSVNEAKSLSKMTVDELDKAHKENEAKIKAYTSNPTKALSKGHPLMTRRRSINLYKIIRAKQTNEEVEQVDELTNKALISYMSKVNDDIAKHKMDPSKRSAEKRNRSVSGFAKAYNKVQSNLKSVKEGKMGERAAGDIDFNPEVKQSETPFDGPYKKSKGTVTDKSGAKHSALSRVRHLARLGVKKNVKEGTDYEKQIIAGYKAKYKPEDVKKDLEKTKKEYESHHGDIEKQGHEHADYRGYHHGKDLMTKYNNLKSIHKMITSD